MKRVTCKQLGGACDLIFEAKTFKEVASLSQQHGMEMAKANDQAHLDAMEEMKSLMNNPQAMLQWMKDKEQMFNSLPEQEAE
jgi:hypothetical protein